MAERRARITGALGADNTDTAIELLTLVEMAWHDCYGDVSPPEDVIDDILLLSEGTLEGLVRSGLLAVVDYRDVRLAADDRRGT
jgi:hypothetical protein